MTIPGDLMEALKVFIAENADDIMAYHIRDSEGEGWDGPRVDAWADTCNTLKRYVEGETDDNSC
jgi:hypothetical protein